MRRKATALKAGAEPAPAEWFDRPLDAAERVIVLGQTRSGKSTWARAHLAAAASRVVVFDTSDPTDYTEGYTPTTVRQLLADPAPLAADACRLAVVSEAASLEELGEEVAQLAGLLRAAGDLLAIWEECGDYCDPSAPAHPAPFILSKLARNGRKQGVACAFISQSAVEIPLRVRRQGTRVVSFVQSEPGDLAALESKCGEEFTKQVREWHRGDPPAIWSLASLVEKNP